jgi:nucleolar protein 14
VDRRFGENDPSLSIEERMLERFTRERQRTSKNSLFNLEDDTELTHYGQSLANLDDFDTIPLNTDSEETDDENPRKGQVDAKTVRSQHFGGFDDDEEEEPNGNEVAIPIALMHSELICLLSLHERNQRQRSCRKSSQKVKSTRSA